MKVWSLDGWMFVAMERFCHVAERSSLTSTVTVDEIPSSPPPPLSAAAPLLATAVHGIALSVSC